MYCICLYLLNRQVNSPEVVVGVVRVDVRIVPFPIRDVTRASPSTDEHRRLEVEIAESVQQIRQGIAKFAHTGFSTGVESSCGRPVCGQGWKRPLGEVINGDDPYVVIDTQ